MHNLRSSENAAFKPLSHKGLCVMPDYSSHVTLIIVGWHVMHGSNRAMHLSLHHHYSSLTTTITHVTTMTTTTTSAMHDGAESNNSNPPSKGGIFFVYFIIIY